MREKKEDSKGSAAQILDGWTGRLDARPRDCVVDRKEDNLRSTVELGLRPPGQV